MRPSRAEDEPQTLEEKTDLLKLFRSEFDTGENFIYGIFSADETEQVGATGLHPRIGPRGLEIGYFVRASAIRQGIATDSSAALTRVGFEVCDADRIEIRIDYLDGGVASVQCLCHRYVDLLHLIEMPDGWKIVNAAWRLR